MDAASTRARNITMLVEQAGGPTAFGKLIERDQVQVSQWTSETKPKSIGGRLARYIEGKLGHEKGWLDHPQWQSLEPAPFGQSQPVRLDPVMLAETYQAVVELCNEDRGIAFRFDDEHDAALFVHAYELRLALPEHPSTAQLIQFGRKVGQYMAQQGAPAHGQDENMPTQGGATKRSPTGVRRKKA